MRKYYINIDGVHALIDDNNTSYIVNSKTYKEVTKEEYDAFLEALEDKMAAEELSYTE